MNKSKKRIMLKKNKVTIIKEIKFNQWKAKSKKNSLNKQYIRPLLKNIIIKAKNLKDINFFSFKKINKKLR